MGETLSEVIRDPVDEMALPRTERKRRRRARAFLEAAQDIIATEGLDALTMKRLAEALDTVESAVYRYFPSKSHLVAELQRESMEILAGSLGQILERAERRWSEEALDRRTTAAARLVLSGQWFCAAALHHPQQVRLLQVLQFRQPGVLDLDGADSVVPTGVAILTAAAQVIADAQDAGAIEPGDAVDRSVVHAASLSGVLVTDDLAGYLPERFGGARLARVASADLIRGWGCPPDLLDEALQLVWRLEEDGPLAP